MSRRFNCPWTHFILAGLSASFLLVAIGQVFTGAGRVLWASRVAQEAISRDQKKRIHLDEISMKRAVQAAFREGGLYVPLEDVILGNRKATVWLAVPFRIPWAGTFVYGLSREFIIESSAGRDQ